MVKRLAIIGAGPKAAAIVARAAVLRDLVGFDKVPEIIVLEADGIGAAWSGDGAYSSGFVTLCTPGEKDVGFPYDEVSAFGGAKVAIAPELFARFSWSSFLVATGRYGDWVDRDRDHPSHSLFAEYLNWVFDVAEQEIVPHAAQRAWPITGDKWCIEYERDGKKEHLVTDGLVLTGSGEPRPIKIDEAIPPGRIFTAETFWPSRNIFLTSEQIEVAVAGDGGSAGTIVAWLAERFAETSSRIWSISPLGTLFPRGDGHAERRWFSFPQGWATLSEKHRRKIIDRTEAGVVSMRNKRLIDRSQRIMYEAGKLEAARWNIDELALTIEYDGKTRPLTAQYLVNAIGFDSWSRLGLIEHCAAAKWLAGPRTKDNEKKLDKDRIATELAIGSDLSMPSSSGFPPGLHIPALASVAQGPGMGNLGCLGLMAARILKSYLT